MKNAFLKLRAALAEDFKTSSSAFAPLMLKCLILGTMLGISLFWAPFVYITFAFAVLFMLTQNSGKVIYYIVFLMPLMGIFKIKSTDTYYLAYLLCLCLVILAVKLVIELFVKKTKKINWWFTGICAVMVLYFMFPFTFPDFGITFSLILGVGLLFFAYYFKEDLDAKELALVYVFGVVMSMVFGLFRPISPRMQELVVQFYAYSLERFSGAYTNPNILAGEMMFALAIVYTLFINKQVKVIIYPLIIAFEIALIYTMSKAGLIIFTILNIGFVIVYLIKNHKKGDFVRLAVILGIVLLTLVIFHKRFMAVFGRITDSIVSSEVTTPSGEVVDKPHVNLEELTTGRSTIWKNYFEAIFANLKSTLFGYGVGAPYIGEWANISDWCPHNTYLQCLYFVGLFGVALIFAWIVSVGGFKKFKEIKWQNILPFFALALYLGSAEFFSFRLAIYMLLTLMLLVQKEDKPKVVEDYQTAETKIPKVFHYIWLGGKPLPKKIEKCIASWQKVCPDFVVKRWDESNLNLELNDYVKEALKAKKYAFASDVLRFDILEKEGGVYMDIDVCMLAPFGELLNKDMFMGFEYNTSVAPGLVMGATKGNKHVKALLDSYGADHFILPDGSQNLNTICVRTTNYLVNLGLKLDGTLQEIDGITVCPTEYFCPYSPITGRKNITENTRAIHLYYSSWYSRSAQAKKYVKRVLNFLTNGYFGIILEKFKGKKNA